MDVNVASTKYILIDPHWVNNIIIGDLMDFYRAREREMAK